MSRTSPISSTVKPPKKLSSKTRACRRSGVAKSRTASPRISRFNLSSSKALTARSSVTQRSEPSALLAIESENSAHTFETTKENIQQVKTNNPFKQIIQEKKGSYKIILKSEGVKGVELSFAPQTDNIAESKMIIRLTEKSQ